MDIDKIIEQLVGIFRCEPTQLPSIAQKYVDENRMLKTKIKTLRDFVDECVTFHG